MRRLYYFLPLAALTLCAVLWARVGRYPTGTSGPGWTTTAASRGGTRRPPSNWRRFRTKSGVTPGSLVAAYRVTDVRRCPGRPIQCGPAIRVREGVYRENPACEGSPFAVDVQTYTFFGVPFGSADLPCEG